VTDFTVTGTDPFEMRVIVLNEFEATVWSPKSRLVGFAKIEGTPAVAPVPERPIVVEPVVALSTTVI
jgi:hypothetical protein